MLQYYEQRQQEYETIYAKPERQKDLAWLDDLLVSLVAGKRVLEIACGTGYWTRRISKYALSVHATDASQQLASAAVASCVTDNVTSGTIDAFNVPASPGFDCLVAGFFFSHVPIKQRNSFLQGLAKAVKSGTRLVMFDNKYVQNSSTPISRRSNTGDTYQIRELSDGSCHEVLKNFPTIDNIQAVLGTCCNDVDVIESEYFWLATGFMMTAW